MRWEEMKEKDGKEVRVRNVCEVAVTHTCMFEEEGEGRAKGEAREWLPFVYTTRLKSL
jgi:hypothetical protein